MLVLWKVSLPFLVGGFNPSQKILVNLDQFPQNRDEHSKKTYLKPPPSCVLKHQDTQAMVVPFASVQSAR